MSPTTFRGRSCRECRCDGRNCRRSCRGGRHLRGPARGGIESRLEAAELEGAAPLIDGPCRVLVAGHPLERALEVLEADDDDEDEDDE